MGVTDTKAGGERLEAGVGHLVNIADAAIGNSSHGSQSPVGVTVHLTPKGANKFWLIEVLYYGNIWSGYAGKIGAIIFPRLSIFVSLVAHFHNESSRVTNHWSHLRHEIIRHLEVEGIGCSVVLGDLFPAIIYGGSIPALELKKFRVRKVRVHRHVVRINQLAADHNRYVRDIGRIC